MREKIIRAAIGASLGLSVPLIPTIGFAQDKAEAAKPVYPSPGEIVAAAKAEDWAAIAPSDLLVMDLAKDARGKDRRVVIQLMPAPFSQGWIGNIRKLAAAKFWDGTSVNRVQDNYVVQWGDPNAEDDTAPASKEPKPSKAKLLPSGLVKVPGSDYVQPKEEEQMPFPEGSNKTIVISKADVERMMSSVDENAPIFGNDVMMFNDSYAALTRFTFGWPIGMARNEGRVYKWPVHCYGMVGVGRNLSPDTGSGTELYTVIGHAPRHLDRNVALVGRVIEGMEHLSSLPRGTGALGFYEKEEERVPILSIRLMSEMPSDKSLPAYQYLSTESESFAKYADARANRRDPFFNVPAGGADICNIPVPVRRQK